MPRGTKREILLNTGRELFHSQGYEATGVGEVTKTAGVPKGSFYNYFDSKEAFALEILEIYVSEAQQRIAKDLEEGEGPHLLRLRRLYESWIDGFNSAGFSSGCLTGALCQEMAGREDTFRSALDGCLGRMRRAFTENLKRAQEAGELSPAKDPDRLARFLHDAWQGALQRMKVEQNDRPLRDFVDLVFGHLLV